MVIQKSAIKDSFLNWRNRIKIDKSRSKIIKLIILAVCFAAAEIMAIAYSGFSVPDFMIILGMAAAALIIYAVDVPIFIVFRAAAALAVPAVCFLTFETLTHKMTTMIDLAVKLNLFFYYWLFFMVFFISGKTRISMAICVIFVMVVGISNYFVVLFRSNPIVPWDIYSLKTAMGVAGNYSFTISWDLAVRAALFLLLLIVGTRSDICIRKPVVRGVLAALMLVPGFFFVSYLWQDDLERNTGLNDTLFNSKYMHSKDGFFVSFILDIHFLSIQKPEGYTPEYSLALLSEQEVQAAEDPTARPNVIVIMDESFSDPAVLGEFETNKDYMPFVHSILNGEVENTISGSTYVSVLGGNTANSEFEFLTGNSMAFFPNCSVPYLQYIRKGADTIVSQFNDMGYETFGVHPYRANGWNRQKLYSMFGFDQEYFLGEFPYETKLRKYVSDDASFRSVMKWYNESEDPVFIFNVTMQNHSNYGNKYNQGFKPQIKAELKKTSVHSYLDNYLSLMYETDKSLEKLINELKESDEPTIVLFFGDHQPNDYVVKPIYREYGLDFENQSLEQQQKRQITPFFIWANYDIEEQTDLSISLNYMNILLFETAGFQLDEYQTFRKNLWQGDVPIMNAAGYWDADGQLHSYDDKTDKIAEEFLEYQNIQYYRMTDEY